MRNNTARFIAQLILAAPKGLRRKQILTAIAKRDGVSYESMCRGWGSNTYFSGRCLGVYWTRRGIRYHITVIGRRFAETGVKPTEAEREKSSRRFDTKLQRIWAKQREERASQRPALILAWKTQSSV